MRKAEISNVPYLIEGLKPFRAEIEPQLHQSLRQGELGEKERLRLSLAMVAEDEGQVAYLSGRLLAPSRQNYPLSATLCAAQGLLAGKTVGGGGIAGQKQGTPTVEGGCGVGEVRLGE